MTAGVGTRGRRVAWWAVACLLALAAACSKPSQPAVQAAVAASAAVPATAVVVAVLPLADSGDDPDARAFNDGMAQHLARALARVPGIVVISPESSFRFRGSSELNSVIGTRLGATHVLRGVLQRPDGRLRLDLELLQASDGATLWQHHYERVGRELFALQDEAVRALATALRAGPVPRGGQDDRPPSGNPDAYQALLQGDADAAGGDVFSIRAAVLAYQHALELDPGYAHAHARLAQARIRQVVQFPLDEGDGRTQAELARRDAATALRLAPGSTEAQRAQAIWLAEIAHDPGASREVLRRALAQHPGEPGLLNLLALRQIGFGELDAAAASLRQVLQVNPLSAPTHYSLGSVYLGLADYPQAEHELREALALEPSMPLVRAFLAMVLFQQNRTRDAVAMAVQEPQALWRHYALAMAYWADGDRARSEVELQALIREHANDAPTQIAGVHAQRGDREALFHWLEVARRAHDPGLAEIRYMPFVARYADDPRFVALLRAQDLAPPAQ